MELHDRVDRLLQRAYDDVTDVVVGAEEERVRTERAFRHSMQEGDALRSLASDAIDELVRRACAHCSPFASPCDECEVTELKGRADALGVFCGRI